MGFTVLAGLAVLIAAAAIWWRATVPGSAFSERPAVIAQGEAIYAARCASCHGRQLEGQTDWQSPRADGRMPAPPHNSDGHTWHHDSKMLVGITKYGLVPPWAPASPPCALSTVRAGPARSLTSGARRCC